MTHSRKTKDQLLKELDELQKKYNDLLYYLPDALLEVDIINPRLTYMNQMAYSLFGYTEEDFAKGINLRSLLAENEYERVEKIVKGYVSKSQKEGVPYVRTTHQIIYEVSMVKKDGTVFLAETQTSYVLNNEQTPVAMRSIIRDATERKKAEEALKQSEERYALAISAGKVGIWEWDLLADKFYLSPSLKAILGYKDDELKNDIDIWMQQVHPDDRKSVMAEVKACIEGHMPYYEIEHRMFHKDGSLRWMLARGNVTRDTESKPIRMAGSDTDITDRKLAEKARLQAKEAEARAKAVETINQRLGDEISQRQRIEEALRQSEERYRELYQNNPSMYFTVDSDSKVKLVNQFGAEQLGYTVEELIGRSVLDIFYEKDKKAVREQIQICLQNPKKVLQWQFRKTRKDGSLIWVKETARALQESDGNIVVLIVCEDITGIKNAEKEQKALQEQLQQAQKLESIGLLAGGIAHDFNNLLTGILGNTSLILLDLSYDSPLRENIQLIQTAALRAADLTNQLLAYAGKGKYTVEALDLSDLVKEMTQLLATVISKKANLKYNLAIDLPTIQADATQVRQVVMNLIKNASDALEGKSGEITISTGTIKADSAYLAETYLNDELQEGVYVFMEVTDTGLGMDSEIQSKIFDPFFSTKFLGRGLGLAAALGIVRGHHGAIKVKSRPGEGTTIKVLFPVSNKSNEKKTASTKKSGLRYGAGTILVVEDEIVARTVAQKVLEKSGYSVLLANDGQKGLEIFRKNAGKIQAVLLDLTMPKMNGEEALAEMRRIRPDVRVILSSGYSEQEAIARFSDKKLAGFIQKPYQAPALIEKFNKVLQQGMM